MSEMIEYTTTNRPHPFHLVRPSIWPLLASFAAGLMFIGLVLFMHKQDIGPIKHGIWYIFPGIWALGCCMWGWWRDIVNEGVKEHAHTAIAKVGFRYGMALFIASEVMFFFAFFWAFFSAALYPQGGVWPPEGITVIDPLDLPLLMTMILLLSGCTATWAHAEMIDGRMEAAKKALAITVALGVFFLGFQMYEYAHAPFAFKDGVFPSAFFLATGFHGFHVIIGTIFLFVILMRTKRNHFTAQDHFGFEAAAWYWHFVDVVWLFLFIAVYVWGAGDAPMHTTGIPSHH